MARVYPPLLGFVTGLPWVTFCDTVPTPAKTAPLQVTGAHRTIYTHGIGGNRGVTAVTAWNNNNNNIF